MSTEIAEKSMGIKLFLEKEGDALQIAHLTTIGEIGVESEEIDTTSLDSPDGYREFIASLKDAGEVSLEGWIKDESAFDQMVDLADAQTLENWYMETPSGSKWEFTAFVKMFKESDNTIDGVRGFTGTLRVSGKPEYSYSA